MHARAVQYEIFPMSYVMGIYVCHGNLRMSRYEHNYVTILTNIRIIEQCFRVTCPSSSYKYTDYCVIHFKTNIYCDYGQFSYQLR